MAGERYLPDDVPTVFRGGASLLAKDHDVKTDKITGLLKTTHGVSVDSDPQEVAKFGGAYRVVSMPAELTIIQRGRREGHFEIVPASPMPLSEYQELLNQIELRAHAEDDEQ